MATRGVAQLQNMSGIRQEKGLVNLNVPTRDCSRLTCAGWEFDQATSSGSIERQRPTAARATQYKNCMSRNLIEPPPFDSIE